MKALSASCLVFVLFLAGCGGNPSSSPIQQGGVAPAITSQPVSQTVTAPATATFSVTATGTAPLSYEWQKNGTAIAGATSSSYTTPATTLADNGSQFRVVVSNSAGNITSSAATLTVNAPLAAPTISCSPASPVDVTLGTSQNFSCTVTGNPAPSVSCTSPSVGTLSSCSGTGANYTVSTDRPSSFSTSFTVTATNSQGSAPQTIQINLKDPVPAITSVVVVDAGVSSSALFCTRDITCTGKQFVVSGSGFYAGGILHMGIFGDLTLLPGTNFNSINLTLNFDTPHFSPGPVDFSGSTPAGDPGGGTSPVFLFPFIGNQKTLTSSATEYYQLDQGAGQIHVFDLSLNHLRDFGIGTPHTTGIAFDGGNIVLPQSSTFAAIYDVNGNWVSTATNGKALMAVAAKNGWGCVTQDLDNLLSCFDLTQTNPPMLSQAVGSTPMSVKMAADGSGNLTEVTLNIGDGSLSVVSAPPTLQLLRVINLTGFTKNSDLPSQSSGGSWMEILESSSTRTAVVVSRFDKKVWFADIDSGSVAGPFPLDGDPFRIAADNAHGNVVVAIVNPAGGTNFVKVDSAGTVTQLSSTDVLAAGLLISADGNTRVSCSRDVCKSQPNN